MSRPRLLDLFCGAGGAAMGYARAGFDIVGVDITPQPRYPFTFVQADVFELLTGGITDWTGIDAVHASPPCHGHSSLASIHGDRNNTNWMLGAIRERLETSGLPWVIENVPGAPMPGAITLCGTEFGLTALDSDDVTLYLKRHRLFESSVPIWGAGGCSCKRATIGGNYGGGWGGSRARERLRAGRRGGYVPQMPQREQLMGIDWMQRDELAEAIPPAYTQFIGEQLLAHSAVDALSVLPVGQEQQ